MDRFSVVGVSNEKSNFYQSYSIRLLDNEKPLKIGVFPNSEGLKDEEVFFPEIK